MWSRPGARSRILALALEVVVDHGAGGFEDDLRGAIVLLQADDEGVGKVLLELENVADVRAAPGVDALVLVAHGADVLVLAGEQLHQLVLRAVGVLVLVDEQVAVTALVALARFAETLSRRTASRSRSSKSMALFLRARPGTPCRCARCARCWDLSSRGSSPGDRPCGFWPRRCGPERCAE